MFVVDELNPDLMRKFRFYLDYSQEKMAENLGVNRVSYSRWESGAQMPESPKMLQLAFEALLNRRIMTESGQKYLDKFKLQAAETNKILAETDRMQKMRVRRKNVLS